MSSRRNLAISGGTKMARNAVGFSIESLTVSGGKEVTFGPDDLVVIVGPNNAGKSAFLRELWTRLQQQPGFPAHGGPVLSKMSIRKTSDRNDAWEVIRSLGRQMPGSGGTYFLGGAGANIDSANTFVTNTETLAPLHNWFGVYIDAGSRLGLSQTQPSIDLGIQSPSHPMHYLHQDWAMMAKLNRWFKRAFGTEIAIDHFAAQVIPLHVGPNVAPRQEESVQTDEYRQRLRESPRLDLQGDGMRSFVGLLMHVLLGHQSLFLVDEPETFLHPPQARLLGRLLAENHAGGQVFLATHSADFLRGLLEASDRSIRVLRLTRQGKNNYVSELQPEGVRTVWSDPVLRYSNILDGAFHEKVIICEAEGDCRFYAAVADVLRNSEEHPYVRDIMFAQSGGKGGIPKLVKALKSLDVPVAAAVDFDALCSVGQFRSIVESLGGDWSTYDADYRAVKASIDELGKVSAEAFKRKLLALTEEIDDKLEEIDRKTVSNLRNLLRTSVGDGRAKESGVGMLGREAKAAADRLLRDLADLGLFVVPGGELESFVVDEPAEKNAWVAAVLERYGANIETAPELAAARDFVASMIKA